LWWFSSEYWKPGDWLRASFIGSHSTLADRCYEFKTSVQILEERSETITNEECGESRPETVKVTHWVRFRVTGEVGSAFDPMSIRTRFAVII